MIISENAKHNTGKGFEGLKKSRPHRNTKDLVSCLSIS